MSIRKILLVVCLGGMTLAGVACKPELVGADAAVYSGGKLYAVVSRNLDTVYAAATKAVRDLELEVKEEAKDVFSGKVLAVGADGKNVSVILKPRPDGSTDVSVKVGPLGNQQRSVVIFDQIKKNLGMAGK